MASHGKSQQCLDVIIQVCAVIYNLLGAGKWLSIQAPCAALLMLTMGRPSLQLYSEWSMQLDAWCRKQLDQLNQQEDSQKWCKGSCSGGWHITNAAGGHSHDADVGTVEAACSSAKLEGL